MGIYIIDYKHSLRNISAHRGRHTFYTRSCEVLYKTHK